MRLIPNIWQVFCRPKFADEDENRKATTIFLITRVCFIGLVTILGIRIVGLGSESNIIIPLFVGLFLISFSHIFLLEKRVEMASYSLLITLFGLISYFAIISDDGYHDTVLFAVPGLLIIAGILLEKWQFYIFTTITLLLIAVMVTLENIGLHQTRFSPFVSPYDGVDIIFIIAITAFSVRILTNNLIESLQCARKNEKALQESEAQYRTLVEKTNDAIFVIQKQTGRYLEANQAAEQLTGRTLSELKQLTTHDITPDRGEERLKIAAESNLTMGLGSVKYYRPDGTCRIAQLNTVPLDSETEIGIARDITEHKLAEEALQLTRFSIEHASDAVFWTTSDARIVDVNKAACQTLGYTRQELLKLSLPDVDPHCQAEVWTKNLAELRLRGSLKFESEHLAKDGRLIPVEIVSNYVQFGVVERICDFVRDITDRKLAEKETTKLEVQLQQAQKMEAIGTLAGGIAHDFNNILSAVFGYSELIREDSSAGSETFQYITQVLKAGTRAKELVRQILAFSHQADIDKIPLQPAPIIKEAVKMLRASIPTTITIKQDIDSDAGIVMADPTQIHQIVMNLCTNAFHAMEMTGGTLTISLHKKTVRPEDLNIAPNMQPGKFVQLLIKDTGEGIPPEIQSKIFDPFFTTKEVGKGTGIGLSVVHGIVKNYGGSITCDSLLEKGTVFNVTLPTVEDSSVLENEYGGPIQGGNEHILLIDDEEMLIDLGRTMLERLGYQVTARRSSLDALSTFQDQPNMFDLVITDQTMPVMTGIDLARRIMQIRPEIPIILCTGYSIDVTKEKVEAMGMKGFVMKPLTLKALAKLIRKILD